MTSMFMPDVWRFRSPSYWRGSHWELMSTAAAQSKLMDTVHDTALALGWPPVRINLESFGVFGGDPFLRQTVSIRPRNTRR